MNNISDDIKIQWLESTSDGFEGSLQEYAISVGAIPDPEPKKYNGWTNWETWLVNLHLAENDYEDLAHIQADLMLYEYGQEIKRIVEDGTLECLENADDLPVLISDMVSGNLSEVNWLEIAEYHIKQYICECDLCVDVVEADSEVQA